MSTAHEGRISRMRRISYAMRAFVALGALAGCSTDATAIESAPTRAEYFVAAQKAAQCIRDEGYIALEPEEEDDAYMVGYGIPAKINNPDEYEVSEAEQEQLQNTFDRCWDRHAKQIGIEYLSSLALSGEAWESEYRNLVSCMEEAGVTGIAVGDKEDVVTQAMGLENEKASECYFSYRNRLFNPFLNE